MQIHISVHMDAKDEKDVTPENLVYQAFTGSFETAHQHLNSLQAIVDKDIKDEAWRLAENYD